MRTSKNIPDQSKKTIIVTGANTGVGLLKQPASLLYTVYM